MSTPTFLGTGKTADVRAEGLEHADYARFCEVATGELEARGVSLYSLGYFPARAEEAGEPFAVVVFPYSGDELIQAVAQRVQEALGVRVTAHLRTPC